MNILDDPHCVYLTRRDLAVLDTPPAVIAELMRTTPHTGTDGQPIVTQATLDAAMATWRAIEKLVEGSP